MTLRVLERLAGMVATVWVAATLAFWALQVIPGDAITAQLIQSGVGRDEIAARKTQLGLDQPALQQYQRFMQAALRGDLGVSLLSGEPVHQAVARSIPPTAELALAAFCIAVVWGVSLGIAGALTIPFVSGTARFINALALSVPAYWTGTIAIFIFAARLDLLPSAGAGRLDQLILPANVLGFHVAGGVARLTHTNVALVLSADFVRTARAKGLKYRQVLWRHILRVGLLPVIAVMGVQAGFLLSGTVIIESLFVRPGLGSLLVEAVTQQDYPIVLGIIIWSALVYGLIQLVADWLYQLCDPRVTF